MYALLFTAHVEVDASLLTSTGPASPGGTSSGSGTPLQMTSAPKKKKHRLDSTSDTLYAQIRDLNFAVVGEALHRAAQRLSADYEGRHTAQTVAQMRAFVGKLGGLQTSHAGLRLHTSLTERIMSMTSTADFNAALEVQQNIVAGIDLQAQLGVIEGLICSEAPLLLVLRLLCLLSVVGGGIKAKQLESITREILQTYGYQHLALLLALSKVGLLVRAPTSTRAGAPTSGLASVRSALRLINDDVDEKNPRDISYVYSGYAPLSVRLVQAVAQKEALLETPVVRKENGDAAAAANGSTSRLPRAHPIVGWRGFEDVGRVRFDGGTGGDDTCALESCWELRLSDRLGCDLMREDDASATHTIRAKLDKACPLGDSTAPRVYPAASKTAD